MKQGKSIKANVCYTDLHGNYKTMQVFCDFVEVDEDNVVVYAVSNFLMTMGKTMNDYMMKLSMKVYKLAWQDDMVYRLMMQGIARKLDVEYRCQLVKRLKAEQRKSIGF